MLRRFNKSSEVDFPLFDLHVLLLALALIILVRVLVEVLARIRFLGLRTIFSKVGGTPTIKATFVVLPMIELLIIWPWTRLLLLLLLLRH